MQINNKPISNNLTIANSFNKFFGEIAEHTKSKIRPTSISPMDYMGDTNSHSIFMKPTTTIEIGNLILSLQENKATGPGSIPTTFLKLLAPTISPLL